MNKTKDVLKQDASKNKECLDLDAFESEDIEPCGRHGRCFLSI